MQAAAQTYARLCASGHEPAGLFYSIMLSAARYHDMLDDPAVLAASRWQEWLHPRGIDGRFIESGAMVDIFASGGDRSILENAQAPRRRAKINHLFPEGASVQYYDTHGNPVKADPANGYPGLIPLSLIETKVSGAPNSKARLPGISSREEFTKGYHAALTQTEYDAEIVRFNNKINADLKPERSANHPGSKVDNSEYNSHLDFVTEVTDLGLGKSATDKGIGLAGESAFKDSYGNWSQEQLQQMLIMADDLFGQITAGKPKGQKAIMLGGLPGSGKSSLLDDMSAQGTLNRADWVEINPDLVKEAMIAADWYPKVEGLAPGETSGFIHAQSSEMASMLERMAMKDGYNLIFDVTMGGAWTDQTMELLNFYNYAKPDGIFIESDTNHSLASIVYRHRTGLDKLRTGVSRRNRMNDPEIKNGGRFVPNKALGIDPEADPNAPPPNIANFERLKPQFANWAKYNVGNEPGKPPNPTLIESTDQMPGVYPAGTFDGMALA